MEKHISCDIIMYLKTVVIRIPGTYNYVELDVELNDKHKILVKNKSYDVLNIGGRPQLRKCID